MSYSCHLFIVSDSFPSQGKVSVAISQFFLKIIKKKIHAHAHRKQQQQNQTTNKHSHQFTNLDMLNQIGSKIRMSIHHRTS